MQQLKEEYIIRDLAKSYVGFKGDKTDPTFEEGNSLAVVTGKWGCGVFGGIPELKLLI